MFFFRPAAVCFEVPVVGEVGVTNSCAGGDGTEYTAACDVATSIEVHYVYLLAKYGCRIDIGFNLFGVSAVADLGIGARMVDGHICMDTSSVGVDDNYGRVERLLSDPCGIVADVAVEAGIHFVPNFRLVVRPGFMTTFVGFNEPADSV